MIVVSSCLCGINCKYSGENNLNENVLKLVNEGKAVPICPEQLGGLKTPRNPAEIIEKAGEIKVVTEAGADVTDEFLLGAKRSLEIAKVLGAKKAILQRRSPSCGFGKIYDGTFSGKLIPGNGLTVRLFLENGIEVISDEEYDRD
ncbi:MAG: DUF523 domain-containing protein [Fusobacterium sp. JB021]|nr:DUF523 domain-containing protein [Fusobacterium sp. JB021]MDP0506628.1 DUF523 domain-containing protein [Fusobacterium sp. JB019]